MVHQSYSSKPKYSKSVYLKYWFCFPILSEINTEIPNAIVMKYGTKYSLGNFSSLFNLIENDLNYLNSIKIAHTDIRLSNLLMFNNRVFIIDYDNAVCFENEEKCILSAKDILPGDRLDCIKEALFKKKDSSLDESFEWSLQNEKNMAQNALFKFLLNNVKEINNNSKSNSLLIRKKNSCKAQVNDNTNII